MSKKKPESPLVEPVLTEPELFAAMATALNRIAIVLESIDQRQKTRVKKRIVLTKAGAR